MISFACDYTNGAHPKILEAFIRTNNDCQPGYGTDIYTASAKNKIKAACNRDVEVEFITGGTQTNMIVISTMLNDYEGVISAYTGHIGVHEAGAIEYTGHKVLPIAPKEGKLVAKDVKKYIDDFYADGSYSHMVFPGMVYISNPTEYGTIYSKQELTELSNVCREYGLPLYMDGARLGYGLVCRENDLTLGDICDLCDVFYIGGTKVGALCGEAVVFTKNNRPKHFTTSVKKRGALVAKGRLIGIQFDTLFTDGLYFEISKNAIEKAEKLKALFESLNMEFFINSPTNQQFPILKNELVEKLKGEIGFEIWGDYGEDSKITRFATSWSSTGEELDALSSLLKQNQ